MITVPEEQVVVVSSSKVTAFRDGKNFRPLTPRGERVPNPLEPDTEHTSNNVALAGNLMF